MLIYLFEIQNYRERKDRITDLFFLSLESLLNGHNGGSWARLNPETRNEELHLGVPCRFRSLNTGPFFAAFPGVLRGSLAGSEAVTT